MLNSSCSGQVTMVEICDDDIEMYDSIPVIFIKYIF
jgi:hypothetical protein